MKKTCSIFYALYECCAHHEFLSSEDAKTKIGRKKKELYCDTRNPFQCTTIINSRKNEKKNSVGRVRLTELDKKKQNRHRRSVIIKVRKSKMVSKQSPMNA